MHRKNKKQVLRYVLWCTLIGGVFEYLASIYIDYRSSMSVIPAIVSGIALSSFISWRGIVGRFGTINKRTAIRIAFLMAAISHLIVLIFYFLFEYIFLYSDTSPGILLYFLILSLIGGLAIAVYLGVIFVPLYYCIGYFLIEKKVERINKVQPQDLLDD